MTREEGDRTFLCDSLRELNLTAKEKGEGPLFLSPGDQGEEKDFRVFGHLGLVEVEA